MSEKVLNVGVVGVGGIAQMMHLPTLAERPDWFKIVALADVDQPSLQAVGARYGVTSLHPDVKSMLATPGLDAVMLCQSGSHAKAAIEVLKAKKHLFVEKPLGMDLRETEEVEGELRKSLGVTCMVGYHKRYDPAIVRAREAIKALGELRYVEVTVLHPDDGAYRTHHAVLPIRERKPVPEPLDRAGLVKEVTTGSLAPHMALVCDANAPTEHKVAAFLLSISLIHDLDLLRSFLGEPEGVISAHVWQDGFAQSALIRFTEHVRANVSWVSVPGLKHYEERLRFVSSTGRVTLTFPSPYLRHFPTPFEIERMDGDELVIEQRTISFEEAFRAELYHFRESVLGGTEPHTNIRDALGDARLIQAIARKYGTP